MKDTLRALFARKYFITYELTHSLTGHRVTGWSLRHLWPWQNLVLDVKKLRTTKLHEFDNTTDTFDLKTVDRV